MVKQISHGECLAFTEAKAALPNNRFHAIQEMAGVKKWWCVAWKNGELTTIIGTLSKAKAEKLAAGLNKVLGVN